MSPRVLLIVALAAILGWSFLRHDAWLQLCAGLALFLFGMQCLEDGLRQLAGGGLERLLARSTRTPLRGLLSGMAATTLLQSSTLVSLLTIAFLGSGLIQLGGGIAILLGANLGATSGIWLLALAGHDVSLAPVALPLLVFGVLAGFGRPPEKAAGRLLLGVAFLFFGIDQIKVGFAGFGDGPGLGAVTADGAGTIALCVGIGVVATLVLQSSHASLMLTLTALSGGQIGLDQAFAVAIGANVGSSVSTAVVGMLGGNRSGQRLAIAHVVFNATTAMLALLLLAPLGALVHGIAGLAGFGDNPLLQLALFHTLFNVMGVALFWPLQGSLASALLRWWPDRPDTPAPASADATEAPLRARHLGDSALESADAAAAAVALELRHLGVLGLEVICESLALPLDALDDDGPAAALPPIAADAVIADADLLYRHKVKAVHGDLIAFMSRLEVPMDAEHQAFWTHCQIAAMQIVDAVKSAKHLQKNLRRGLAGPDSPARDAYLALRAQTFLLLRGLRRNWRDPGSGDDAADGAHRLAIAALDAGAARWEARFRDQVLAMVRDGRLQGAQAGSLLNDLGYAARIYRSLRDLVAFADEPGSLRLLRRLGTAQPAA